MRSRDSARALTFSGPLQPLGMRSTTEAKDSGGVGSARRGMGHRGVPPQMVDATYNSSSNTAALSVDRKPAITTPVTAGALDVRSQVVVIVEVAI